MYRAVSANPNAIPPSGYWREYLPLSGWQPRVQGAPIGYAGEDNSDLLMNESGELAVLFSMTLVNNAGDALRALSYDGDWNQYQTLTLADLPDRPRGVMDGTGSLLAVWRQSEDDDILVAAGCESASGWDVQATFTPDGPLAEPHAVAGDAAGNALLLWTETVGGVERLRHVRYRASTQQWAAEFPEPQLFGDVSGAQLAMAPNGVAFAVWTEQFGARRVIRGSQYTDGSGWSSPVTIASDANLDCFNPRLAVSSDGTATVAFLRGTGSIGDDVMVSRFE
ncbi:MAG TPA: hypothetical protein VJU16_00990, partial [Planctomycetota bacterium]|nr:hypothetical protein [Planctomycetota bacterium]